MKAFGFVTGGILSIAIAILLIGFTSAMQIQETLLFAGILCVILCPTFAWAFGKFRRKAN
jgi:ABC-type transport system involved in cytochrome bd biosynthesis fused ATPase/permease subunit